MAAPDGAGTTAQGQTAGGSQEAGAHRSAREPPNAGRPQNADGSQTADGRHTADGPQTADGPRTRARRFTRAELESFHGAKVDDLVGPGMKLLFVGINPGLWTAAVNAHFARPGNRFWPALQLAGITARRIDASRGLLSTDRDELLRRGRRDQQPGAVSPPRGPTS